MNPLIPALIESVLEAVLSQGGAQRPEPPPALEAPAGVLRTIPPGAQKATMNPPERGTVKMGSQTLRLAPGSQIRDQLNRILPPMMIQEPVLVRYTTDPHGYVHRVWILTQAEAEQTDPQ